MNPITSSTRAILGLILTATLNLFFIAAVNAQCAKPSFRAPVSINANGGASDIATGDINSDGIKDLVLPFPALGEVHVLLGTTSGIPTLVKVSSVPQPLAVGLGDLSNDGKLDLVVTNNASSGRQVFVLLGDGAGGFGAPISLATSQTNPVVIADFNNDNNLDVFIGGFNSVLHLGNGAGGLSGPTNASTVSNSSVVAADFNNDNKIDLALANASSSVSISLGDGLGHFGTAKNFSVSRADSIAAGDFNNDGKLDIVTAGQSDGISLLLGNGNGDLAAPLVFNAGFNTTSIFTIGIAVDDFNGDGKPDVAVSAPLQVTVLLGNGNAGFTTTSRYLTASSALKLVAADFNGDGKADFASHNMDVGLGSSGNRASLFFGDGDGKLKYPLNLAVGQSPFAVRSGDLNGDGRDDLVYSNINHTRISVLLNQGDGTFSSPTNYQVGSQPRSVTLADFNGDQKLDAVTANFSSNTLSVLFGDGAGTFGSATTISVPGFGPDYTVVQDLNNDSKPDILVGYLNSNRVTVLLGNGTGEFGAPIDSSAPSGNQDIAVNDFNRDGLADLALGTQPGIAILLGSGNGAFGPATTLPTSATVAAVEATDFNGDGKPDIAALVINTNTLNIYHGDGLGGFGSPQILNTAPGVTSMEIADYNGDGNTDIAEINGSGIVSVFSGDGVGGFGTAVSYLVGSGSPARSVTNGDFNSDGHTDLAFADQSGSISVMTNSCSAPTLNGPTLNVSDMTVVEGDSGTTNATFNLTLSSASSRTVEVDYYTAAVDATKDVDYQTRVGRISFAPGVTTQTVSVSIVGDTLDEFDEQVALTLVFPVNATLLNANLRATIVDDDLPPTVSINDVVVNEGNGGNTVAAFTVSLSGPSGKPISVSATTANGSAEAGSDFQTLNQTVNFSTGQTAQMVNVNVLGDHLTETDETFFVNLSNPGNTTILRQQGVGTITNDDATIQLSASAFNVAEGSNSLTVTITRSGFLARIASVDYITSDAAAATPCNSFAGTASSRCDYLTTLGTLTFVTGETSKTISIPIVDDVYAEGTESFSITLSNAGGASLGLAASNLLITDNDSVTGSINPIDESSFFVRQHYLDFLNREPDSSGSAFWVGTITGCGSDPACIEVKRINLSAAFFLSIEFQETGYFVYRIHKASFGNLPGAPTPVSFLDFLKGTQETGRGVQVGVGDWEAQLEANKQKFSLEFVSRQAFMTSYPVTLTADQFVSQMDSSAGSVLTPSEKANLVAILGSTPSDPTKRASVLRAVAENGLLRTREFNKAFVLMQYFGYLRRDPNAAPNSDFSGFNFWLNKLEMFNGNFVNAEMVKAFLLADEYRKRFGN